MSVVQGGPAPNFLAPPVVSYLVGKPLLTEGNKNQHYKSACEIVSTINKICNMMIEIFDHNFHYLVFAPYSIVESP